MTLPKAHEIVEIELPKIPDYRGNLMFLYSGNHVPFKIQQAYWMYDISSGSKKKGYALVSQKEFIISLCGSFTLEISDGVSTKEILLSQPQKGVYVPAGIWRTVNNPSNATVTLVLSDGDHKKSDCIRDFKQFKSYRNVF